MVRSGHDCELLEADNELEVEVATGRSMLFASMSQAVRNDTDKPVFYLKEGRRVIFISPFDSDSPPSEACFSHHTPGLSRSRLASLPHIHGTCNQ